MVKFTAVGLMEESLSTSGQTWDFGTTRRWIFGGKDNANYLAFVPCPHKKKLSNRSYIQSSKTTYGLVGVINTICQWQHYDSYNNYDPEKWCSSGDLLMRWWLAGWMAWWMVKKKSGKNCMRLHTFHFQLWFSVFSTMNRGNFLMVSHVNMAMLIARFLITFNYSYSIPSLYVPGNQSTNLFIKMSVPNIEDVFHQHH